MFSFTTTYMIYFYLLLLYDYSDILVFFCFPPIQNIVNNYIFWNKMLKLDERKEEESVPVKSNIAEICSFIKLLKVQEFCPLFLLAKLLTSQRKHFGF